MIDIENKLRGIVLDAVKAEYPRFVLYDSYPDKSDTFPCGAFEMTDNRTYVESQDTNLHENHARIFIAIDIYSNKQNGRKTEAKKIAEIVDNTMQDYNFTRTMYRPTPNVDRSIWRITLRYEAVVAKPTTSGNTDTYKIFRR